MEGKKILIKLTHLYKKLPPELKLVFIFLFSTILLFQKIIEFVKNIFFSILQRINLSIKKNGQLVRNIKKIYRLNRKRKLSKQKNIVYFLPLSKKIKYFLLGSFFSLMFAFLPLTIIIFLQDLPNPKELAIQQLPQTTKIYDRNKILLYEIYTNQNRTLVSLDEIPKYLQKATLAIEDKNFYKHPGFDITSIIRALKENITDGRTIQGGSTITQQLIKSSLLTSEKRMSRKLKEIVLAFWAEHIYTKDQILEMYFNQVPYGGTAWGIEAASEVYLGKSVNQLTLAESAFLAGLTQAPSLYSPYSSDLSLWKKRQKEVLNRMVTLGYISKKEGVKALSEKINFRKQEIPLRAPHFVMYVKDWLIKEHGLAAVEKGGLSVITTLDLKKQDMAQKIVADEIKNSEYLLMSNGAALITNPHNGDILAMVGSKNFNDETSGNVNLTTSLRQPGSTVKVITYSEALQKGYTAASSLDDSPVTYYGTAGTPPYSPVNYDGRYYGRVTLRFALANSLNLPAVKTLNSIGIPNMVSLARKMGIESWDQPLNKYGLSTTLGASETTMTEMATVFGTLSNMGQRMDLNPILKVTDAKGNILEEKRDIEKTKVLPEGVAYIISNILSDSQTRSAAFGTNNPLIIPGHTVSVKTGTSDNKRDNWTIGFSKKYLVTVWVGNNDNSPMSQSLASGISGAAPIWHGIMVNLLGNTPDNITPIPNDVIVKKCGSKNEYFLKGTERSTACNINPSPIPSITPQLFTNN